MRATQPRLNIEVDMNRPPTTWVTHLTGQMPWEFPAKGET